MSKVEKVQKLKELRQELIGVRENKKEVIMVLALANYNLEIKEITKGNMQLVYELLSTELEGIYRCGCAYADQIEMVEMTGVELTSCYVLGDIKGMKEILLEMDDIRNTCMNYDEIISHIEYYSNEEDRILDEMYEIENNL